MTVPVQPGVAGYPQQPQYPAGVPQMPPGVHHTQTQYQQPAPQPYPIQYPAPQPMYPAQQPMPQGPGPLDMNQRLSGPGIPQELQGKTMGEAIRYYGIMREDFVRRNQQPQPQQQPQMQQPAQPQYQQPMQPGQSQQPGRPDPLEQRITETVQRALAPVVAPIQEQNMERTYNTVKVRFPDWQQFENDILTSLRGAPMETLHSPEAWEAAYYWAKGRAMSRAGNPSMGYPQQPQQPQQPQYPQAPGYTPPSAMVPFHQGPSFVEGPTPAAPGGGPNGAQDPRDEIFARRFGVPVEVYRSWKGGRVGLVPNQQQAGMMPPQQQVPGYPQQQPGQLPMQHFNPPGYVQPQVPGFAPAAPNGGVMYGY